MPNPGSPIAPGAYSNRMEKAKKMVESMDPAVKAKLKEYYPEVKKEDIASKALAPKQGSQANHHVTTVPPKKNLMNQPRGKF